jgi:hypothetical protein
MEGIFDDIATADTQALITSSMNKNGASKELCNRAICNWVCINLQSFSVTGDLNFIMFIEALLKFAPPGYKPPLSHLVRGKYLNGAYEKSKKDANKMFTDMEHKATLTIMSDGKTNSGKVPIVNYIAKSAHDSHFLAAVDMGTKEKDNKEMAEYLHSKCVETGFGIFFSGLGAFLTRSRVRGAYLGIISFFEKICWPLKPLRSCAPR